MDLENYEYYYDACCGGRTVFRYKKNSNLLECEKYLGNGKWDVVSTNIITHDYACLNNYEDPESEILYRMRDVDNGIFFETLKNEEIIQKIATAKLIATLAHKGQKDKGGQDYINHPLEVAANVYTSEQKIVALLHDVVEDTDVTIEDLKDIFDESILSSLALLTKSSNENYFDYINKIKMSNDQTAIEVKLADLMHNSDISRISHVTPKDIERVKKYKQAIEILRN